jgi:hypothetical protein
MIPRPPTAAGPPENAAPAEDAEPPENAAPSAQIKNRIRSALAGLRLVVAEVMDLYRDLHASPSRSTCSASATSSLGVEQKVPGTMVDPAARGPCHRRVLSSASTPPS